MNLGEGHFGVRIEALPGERVLFEGGPSRHGMTIRLARAFAPLAFLAAIFLSAFIMSTVSPDPPPRATAAPSANTSAPVGAPAATAPPRQASRAVVLTFVLLTVTGCLGLCAMVAAAVILQGRHGWVVVTSERLCIQSGGFTRGVAVIDLDKVLSVEVSASILERRFGLQSLRIVHAGGAPQATAFRLHEPNLISFVPVEAQLVTRLLNEWLPRDNRGRG